MYNIINPLLSLLLVFALFSLALSIFYNLNYLSTYFIKYDIENTFYLLDDAIRSSCKTDKVTRKTILNIALVNNIEFNFGDYFKERLMYLWCLLHLRRNCPIKFKSRRIVFWKAL